MAWNLIVIDAVDRQFVADGLLETVVVVNILWDFQSFQLAVHADQQDHFLLLAFGDFQVLQCGKAEHRKVAFVHHQLLQVRHVVAHGKRDLGGDFEMYELKLFDVFTALQQVANGTLGGIVHRCQRREENSFDGLVDGVDPVDHAEIVVEQAQLLQLQRQQEVEHLFVDSAASHREVLQAWKRSEEKPNVGVNSCNGGSPNFMRVDP